ncbi:ABC transporter permease [bacterium]|nr:ABC transporter permease [bacterium]
MNTVTTVSSKSDSFGALLRPGRLLIGLRTHWDLWRQLARRDIYTEYRGTVLGFFWSFVQPLLMLAIYTFVFGTIFGNRYGAQPQSSSHLQFAMNLFCGLIMYNIFAETLGRSPGLIVAHAAYVKKVVFPLEILPTMILTTALTRALASLLILFVAALIAFRGLPLTALYFPIIVIPLLMLTLGLSWFLSALGVYLRDVGQVITILLQMLFFLTPIFYTQETMPEKIRWLANINPLAVIVENFRRVLMRGEAPDWLLLGATSGVSVVVLVAGYVWFMKTKQGFADVL